MPIYDISTPKKLRKYFDANPSHQLKRKKKKTKKWLSPLKKVTKNTTTTFM